MGKHWVDIMNEVVARDIRFQNWAVMAAAVVMMVMVGDGER